MPHKKKDPAFLWDMLDAAKAIQSFVTGPLVPPAPPEEAQ